jgi:hypothetical protein
MPSRIDEIVGLWKADLSGVSESAAEALLSPSDDFASFPDYDIALKVEKMFFAQRASAQSTGIPSTDYPSAKDDLELNLIELVKSSALSASVAMETDSTLNKEVNDVNEARVTQEEALEEEDPTDGSDYVQNTYEEPEDIPVQGEEADLLAMQQAEAARLKAEEEAATRVAEEAAWLKAQQEAAEAAEAERRRAEQEAELARLQAEEEERAMRIRAELERQAEEERLHAEMQAKLAEEQRLKAEMEAKLAEEQRLQAEMEALADDDDDDIGLTEEAVLPESAPAESMDDFDDDW